MKIFSATLPPPTDSSEQERPRFMERFNRVLCLLKIKTCGPVRANWVDASRFGLGFQTVGWGVVRVQTAKIISGLRTSSAEHIRRAMRWHRQIGHPERVPPSFTPLAPSGFVSSLCRSGDRGDEFDDKGTARKRATQQEGP
jgi:hypothetical protein